MNIETIIPLLAVTTSIVFAIFAYFYPQYIESRKKTSERKASKALKEYELEPTLEETSSAVGEASTNTWKYLEEIIGGLLKLSFVRPGADLVFLRTVQILLNSFLQSLGTSNTSFSSPTYQNVAFMILINDTDESINYNNYSKNWQHESFSNNIYYQGDVTATKVENEYFEYRFTGTGINCFVGSLPNERGVVDIYLDGNPEGKKEIPSSPIQLQQSVFQKNGLERKNHIIRVTLKEGVLALDSIGVYP